MMVVLMTRNQWAGDITCLFITIITILGLRQYDQKKFVNFSNSNSRKTLPTFNYKNGIVMVDKPGFTSQEGWIGKGKCRPWNVIW